MTSSSDSSTDLSGFAVALGLIGYAVVWLAAPGNYFVGVARTSDLALICYLLALILLAIGVAGLGMELANKEVSAFLAKLVTGKIPDGVWGRPSASTWENLGITFGLSILTIVIHLVGIELLDATGAIGGLVKIIVMLSFGIVVLFISSTIDELAIKPLILTPAHRAAEATVTFNNTSSSQPDNSHNIQQNNRISSPFKRLGAGFIVVGEVVSILYTLYEIITGILAST